MCRCKAALQMPKRQRPLYNASKPLQIALEARLLAAKLGGVSVLGMHGCPRAQCKLALLLGLVQTLGANSKCTPYRCQRCHVQSACLILNLRAQGWRCCIAFSNFGSSKSAPSCASMPATNLAAPRSFGCRAKLCVAAAIACSKRCCRCCACGRSMHTASAHASSQHRTRPDAAAAWSQ